MCGSAYYSSNTEQAIRLPTMCAQSQKEPIECKLLKRLSNSEDWLKGPILEKQRSPADATLTNGYVLPWS